MGVKIITKNKRASYDYQLLEKVEAGLVLQGTEVKSLRDGKAKISEAFIAIDKHMEAWIHNMSIPQYEFGNIANHKETRKRKLLLNKKEIENLQHQIQAKGLTVIPLALYFKGSKVKLEIALGRGKKLYDKRQDNAKKDAQKKIKNLV